VDTSDPGSAMSGNQQFLADLFSTGANAFVDSQYARNYQPNDPHNFNAGRPAGVNSFAQIASNPLLLIGLVLGAVLLYKVARG